MLTTKIGKGPPPEGMDVRRWRKHGQNLRRLERLTGIAPITIDGWEVACVVLMDMLERKPKKRSGVKQ